ncbi:D-alanyl-D-alanine carboxypeptidase, partial [Microbacterium sp.]|uniref:D-alanyl-D-alanine carboxypeptidase n=1 Tax=Microbacterium sp. TaxID=51671 RepID=UPI003C73C672
PEGRRALAWLDDDAIALQTSTAERAVTTDLADSPHRYATVTPDLLERRPRRSPLRAGTVAPILAVLGAVGVYAATTLLWPLHAVAPTVSEVALPDVSAPASALTWPVSGSAAVGVSGISEAAASSADAAPIASIAKLVTVLMILDELPLAPGEQGPSYSFTARDRATYYSYLENDESALNVPVGGSLTQYQMLQGILIGSAGNYTDRLASTVWPNDQVFAAAARTWLARHDLSGITLVEPTGIDPGDVADPAALIALAKVALANPVVAEIVRMPSVELPGAGLVTNTNDLLADPAVVGLKTGSLRGAYNLLAAKDVTIGDTPVRVYATVLGQPTDEARDGETARLLNDLAAQVAVPQILPAGARAGVVTTAWGTSVDIVTDADASVILWNSTAAQVTTSLDLGDARDADAAVGDVRVKGPLNSTTVGVHLTADMPDPDPWWRLTHPLELFGLAG